VQTSVEILRVQWKPAEGVTVAALVGEVDASAEPVVVGIGRVAHVARRIVVDLTRVTAIDRAGMQLVGSLDAFPNITVRHSATSLLQMISGAPVALAS